MRHGRGVVHRHQAVRPGRARVGRVTLLLGVHEVQAEEPGVAPIDDGFGELADR